MALLRTALFAAIDRIPALPIAAVATVQWLFDPLAVLHQALATSGAALSAAVLGLKAYQEVAKMQGKARADRLLSLANEEPAKEEGGLSALVRQLIKLLALFGAAKEIASPTQEPATDDGDTNTEAPPAAEAQEPARLITPALMEALAPGAPAHVKAGYAEHADDVFKKHSLSRQEVAYLLGQIGAETLFSIPTESLNYNADGLLRTFPTRVKTRAEADALAHNPVAIGDRVYGNRMGNGGEGSGDGFRYRGHADLQHTGKGDFAWLSNELGVDLVANPDELLQFPLRLHAACLEWKRNGAGPYAEKGDLEAVSKAINCGNPLSRVTPNGMAERLAWTKRAQRAIDGAEHSRNVPLALAHKPATAVAGLAGLGVAAETLQQIGALAAKAQASIDPLTGLWEALQGISPELVAVGALAVAAWAVWRIAHSAAYKLKPSKQE